jgi:hypothetical protein
MTTREIVLAHLLMGSIVALVLYVACAAAWLVS